MRVLVCGGRNYNNVNKVFEILDGIDNGTATIPGDKDGEIITTIISGCAKGADTHGISYAQQHNLRLEKYPANWNKHGRAAGPIRNKQMIDEGKPDLVVAFPGGRGTANMCKQARDNDITVMEIS